MGRKDLNQKRILAIDLKHSAFSEILSLGVSSNFEQSDLSCFEEWKMLVKNSDVLIQWDPDRDIILNKMESRTIQIGLRNDAVIKYVNEWIVNITDVTGFSIEVKNLVLQGR
jgi:predicted NACHT family NTPase